MTYTPRLDMLVELRSSDALERAMKTRDVNGAELAVIAKTNRQTISNLRRGRTTRTSLATATRIADALRVPPAKLWDLDDVDDLTRAAVS